MELIMKNAILVLVVMLLCNTALANEKKKGKNESVKEKWITLHCLTKSCTYTSNFTKGKSESCGYSPEDRQYHFLSNNHEDNEIKNPTKKLPDGEVVTVLDSTSRTTDSEFYYYFKDQITGFKNNFPKKKIKVAKIEINRITGTYRRIDSTNTEFADSGPSWESYEHIGSCIPAESIKDVRKF